MLTKHYELYRQKVAIRLATVAVILLAITIASLLIGVSGSFWNASLEAILIFRLPRTAVAIVTGGLLGMAGSITQQLFRNPLATPSILGIEAGASLAVTAALVFGLQPTTAPLWALTGAITSLVVLLNFRTNLLLGGLAITTAAGSFASLLLSVTLNDPNRTVTVMQWLLGNLSGRGWTDLLRGSPLAIAGILFTWRQCPALNLLGLGDDIARSSGLSVQKTRILCVITVALLTAAAITSGGILPFVGLIAPHLASRFYRSGQRATASFLTGGALVLTADFIARTLGGARELETGVVTGVIGGPFFLWSIWKREQKK